ncbi:hypothetical protein AgCh_016451 [Apium graveolens]
MEQVIVVPVTEQVIVVPVKEQVIEVPVTEQMVLGPRNGTNDFMVPVMERKIWKGKLHAKIEFWHYAVELPLLSADYGSSEGWIGANVNPILPPESSTFSLLPTLGYYEFIPLKEISDSGLLLLELKPVGYRYRIGDVVKVTGFHNANPKFQFVCRSNLLLNVHLDKYTEKDLLVSAQAVANLLAAEKLEVLDFTSHAGISIIPGHYGIFWEKKSGSK